MDFDSDDEATRIYDASLKYSSPFAPNLAPATGSEYPVDSFSPPVPGQTRPMQPVHEGEIEQPWRESNRKPMMLVLTSVIVATALGIGGYLVIRKPEPGVLNISTTPTDATVTIDGLPVSEGSSPFVINSVEPNTAHQIEVSKKGYQSWTTTVELRPNQTLNIPQVSLESLVTETGFSVDSSPTQAEVYVDGKKLDQTTPVRITSLTPGMHTIRVQKGKAYSPWEIQIQIPKNQVLELSRVILDSRQTKMLASGDVSQVSKERKLRSKESVSKPTSVATASSRKRSSGASRPRVVAQPSASSASSSDTGTLRVNTRPWSQVFVNQKFVGNTPQMNLQLPAGKHNVSFVSPTFGIRKNITVKIAAGKTVTKVLTLNPGG